MVDADIAVAVLAIASIAAFAVVEAINHYRYEREADALRLKYMRSLELRERDALEHSAFLRGMSFHDAAKEGK